MTDRSIASLEACIRHWRGHWAVPGIVVGIYRDGGSTCGLESQVTLDPDRRFALCIWTNSGRGRMAIDPIEAWILENELGLLKPDPVPVDLRDEQLRRLEGRYTNPLGEITVEVGGGALRVGMVSIDQEQNRRIELLSATVRPLSRDRFAVLDGMFKGEVMNFFPRGAERPVFLRRHGRLFDMVEGTPMIRKLA